SVLTDGDNLPALVSPELGEREPTRHLHGVLVLRGDGPAAQHGHHDRNDQRRPQWNSRHGLSSYPMWRTPQRRANTDLAPILPQSTDFASGVHQDTSP